VKNGSHQDEKRIGDQYDDTDLSEFPLKARGGTRAGWAGRLKRRHCSGRAGQGVPGRQWEVPPELLSLVYGRTIGKVWPFYSPALRLVEGEIGLAVVAGVAG